MEYELMSNSIYQHFLAISIMSMGATPFVIDFSDKIADFLFKTPLPKNVRRRLKNITKNNAHNNKIEEENYHDHLIIIGYGLNGENVAKAAKRATIPYLIVDLDPEAIKKAKENNEPIIFGDAANDVILKHLHVHEARVVVVAISSPETTKKIVRSIRNYTRTAYIIVRTRYISEIEENIKAGADQVIPEEFETSIEIFTRVMRKYLVPNDDIKQFVNYIRSRNYEMLRDISEVNILTGKDVMQLRNDEMEIATVHVTQGKNKIVGKSLDSSALRSDYGVTLLAIKRGKDYITDIDGDNMILQDDVLYLLGDPDHILLVNKFFEMEG